MAETDQADLCNEGDAVGPTDLTALAAGLLKTYQLRDRVFGGELFHAPAWEVLLVLQCTELPLSEDHLQQAIKVPLATLRRWIRVLIQERLVRLSYRNGHRFYRLNAKATAGLASTLLAAFPNRPWLDQPFERGADMIDSLIPVLHKDLLGLKSNDDA
jgi:DNA-binding transcriptional ArsR family regulator